MAPTELSEFENTARPTSTDVSEGQNGLKNDFRVTDGWEFLEAVAFKQRTLWGNEDAILWADGEPLLIVGAVGAGKTTLSQRLMLARLGLSGELLGLPVAPSAQNVLYIAADRANQTAWSLRRMVSDEHRDVLNERLKVVHRVYADIADDPSWLEGLVQRFQADTVFIDSLKDVVLGDLSSVRTAAGVHQAIARAIDAGAQVCVQHHTTKKSGRGSVRLDEVYGSFSFVAAAGSVLSISREYDRPLGSLEQLKAVTGPLGGIRVVYDDATGSLSAERSVAQFGRIASSRRSDSGDEGIRLALRGAGAPGLTTRALAANSQSTKTVSRADVERTRRRLARLASEGEVERVPSGGGARGRNDRWRLVGEAPSPN